MAYTFRGGNLDLKAMSEITGEIRKGPDRSLAIVGGAFVERALEQALKIQCHAHEKIYEEFFRPTGALGAFATKVRLGFMTGLYGEEALKDLTYVTKIRNDFAHKAEVRSFKSDQINSWCENLTLCERYTYDRISSPDKIPKRPQSGAIRDFQGWIIADDRSNQLSDPRGRYLLTVQVFMWGLVHVTEPRMPEPLF